MSFCTENLIYLISKSIYMCLLSVNQEKTPYIAEILHANHVPGSSISDHLLIDILCMKGVTFNVRYTYLKIFDVTP